MNPFDLPGPSFLVFYWTLSMFGLLFIYWLRLKSDVEGAPNQLPSDPLMLAYLRDGRSEVVRVALVMLVQAGVVAVEGRQFSLAPDYRGDRPAIKVWRTAVEQELVDFLRTRSATIDEIVYAAVGWRAGTEYEAALEEAGYLRRTRDVITAAGGVGLLLSLVAVIKIAVAISRGRTNVGFLVLSALAVVGLAVILAVTAKRTTRGERALDSAEALLYGTRKRLKDASAALDGQELAWLAAAFGFSVFDYTPTNFAFWPALAFERGARYQGSSTSPGGSLWWSSSCSTTVSSCGGGGGSSCGGGGCGGGGCGGCGGGS